MLLLIVLFTIISLLGQDLVAVDDIFYTSDYELFTGTHTEYYESGTIKSVTNFEEGQLNGTTTHYHLDGTIKEIRNYCNGKFHGIWRQWDIYGTLIGEARFNNSKKEGVWNIWDKNGVKRYEFLYHKGKRIKVLIWNEQGELIDSL